MAFHITPGNAIGCRINAHRTGWNGHICPNAATWNCGAETYFREDYCERGDARCFHIHVFDPANPALEIDEGGAGWIIEADPNALDDQILLLWGNPFQEPVGIREPERPPTRLYGLYRIEKIETITIVHRRVYRVVPYSNGWINLEDLHLSRPYYSSTGGYYIKQVERGAVHRLLDEAARQAETVWKDIDNDRAVRLKEVRDNIEEWFTAAARHVGTKTPAPPPREVPSVGTHQPFKGLADIVGDLPETAVAKPTTAPAVTIAPVTTSSAVATNNDADPSPASLLTSSEPLEESPFTTLLDEGRSEILRTEFDADTVKALQVASYTKPIVILRGEPGVGKSTLAQRLLDDPESERTLVVPVSSTWRGREDLLGYVNPIDNIFEPTAFTRFLLEAARAWDDDDRRTRIVIFEEFNLSQPEYWLSDILVRSQYAPSAVRERTIELGGGSIRDEEQVGGVVLVPSVRFVATVNSDFTTRPLSPRVLDRAAVVELQLDPRQALERAGLALTDDQVDAVIGLSFRLQPKGMMFSFRSALSLARCLRAADDLGLSSWEIIDLVLAQEVLSKLRLLTGDPLDMQLMRDLVEWSQERGGRMPRCAQTIVSWKETLDAGRDVTPL